MTAQQLTVATAYTAPLTFEDANGTSVAPGPIGTVTSSDPSVAVGLSGDGQSVNVTMNNPNVTAILTWNGTGANGPFAFNVTVTDQVVGATPATQGAFGTFVAGTTA